MHLLVQVVEQTEKLTSLLETFAKVGVSGTTVIDSVGMGRVLLESNSNVSAKEIISNALASGRPNNKTIFAVINNDETLKKAIEASKEVLGDLNAPGKGILFTLPLDFVDGLVKNY